MHNDFDNAAKEILSLSDRAIIRFLNASFSASHPPDAPVIRTNTEYRLPSRPGKGRPGGKTVIADSVFLVGENSRYHIEIQLDRRDGMALRMFRYDAAEALEHPSEENGIETVSFPQSLVIYLEPVASAPDSELLRIRFPDGSCYEYRTPVIKLTELSVEGLLERHMVIFAPLYILKLRKRTKQAKTREEREKLAGELKEIYREIGEALGREKEDGNLSEVDGDKVLGMTEVLHREVYGEFNEFEEEGMDFSSLRVIEKLHKEMEDVRRSREEERRSREEAVSRMTELERSREEERRSREEAVSKAAELEQSREEAVSRAEMDRQRTARNILRLGLSVEQVTQATGLPRETVQTLAAQL
ncbi:MAG: hypothetical protein LBK05_07095 [Treponema sp.]|nr:hypothetical protein [Treponema sp.]